MNYISHLNAFFEQVAGDGRVTAYHISLYLAVFQLWNLNRFSSEFPVSRAELMILSRIRSVNTYARCMKELNSWGYIHYDPAANRHTGSVVRCIRFDTGNKIGCTIESTTGRNTGNEMLIKRRNKKTGNKSSPQIFGNARKRKNNGAGSYHVNNNKDYSEPL